VKEGEKKKKKKRKKKKKKRKKKTGLLYWFASVHFKTDLDFTDLKKIIREKYSEEGCVWAVKGGEES